MIYYVEWHECYERDKCANYKTDSITVGRSLNVYSEKKTVLSTRFLASVIVIMATSSLHVDQPTHGVTSLK